MKTKEMKNICPTICTKTAKLYGYNSQSLGIRIQHHERNRVQTVPQRRFDGRIPGETKRLNKRTTGTRILEITAAYRIAVKFSDVINTNRESIAENTLRKSAGSSTSL